MTESLAYLLRRSAAAAPQPQFDVDALVHEAGRRQRRRRTAVVASAAAIVALVAGGSLAVRSDQGDGPEPAPVVPSPTPTAPEEPSSRPLVYAEGSTVHVGDNTIEAAKPVAFIDVTDDGAVYEASLDGTLWFSDGTTSSVIGQSPWTAAPTAHLGVVMTGDSGSLVVWPDVTDVKEQRYNELVVYDTSRREEVGRIPVIGDYNVVLYVDEQRVYYQPDPSSPGCWVVEIQDIHHCPDPHLLRFDVASGKTAKISVAKMQSEVDSNPRLFWRRPLATNDLPFTAGAFLRQVGRQLVAVTFDGEPTPLTSADGDEVRLRLPAGYTVPGLEWGGSVVHTSQWLDDDHIVVWANEGGGDLPPQHGDLLVCRLPDGTCRVEVPRTSGLYVAPGRF